MAFVGFSLAQPYLIHSTITYITYHTKLPENYGYGLIGAYALCYIGLAVSPPENLTQSSHSNFPALPALVDASGFSDHDKDPWSSGYLQLQENAYCTG